MDTEIDSRSSVVIVVLEVADLFASVIKTKKKKEEKYIVAFVWCIYCRLCCLRCTEYLLIFRFTANIILNLYSILPLKLYSRTENDRTVVTPQQC